MHRKAIDYNQRVLIVICLSGLLLIGAYNLVHRFILYNDIEQNNLVINSVVISKHIYEGKTIVNCRFYYNVGQKFIATVAVDAFENNHSLKIFIDDTLSVRYSKENPENNEILLQSYFKFNNKFRNTQYPIKP